MKTILQNVTILHPEQDLNKKADLLIEDGVIKAIDSINPEDHPDADVHKFSNGIVAPGFLDMHVHLREPGREDQETVETGSNAAANGGFTAMACMPDTDPMADSSEVVAFIKQKSSKYIADVYPVAAATVRREGEMMTPMAELVDMGAVAFSDDEKPIKTAQLVRRIMEYGAMFDTPIIEHCHDESMSKGEMNESFQSTFLGLHALPSIAEDLVVSRDIMIAEYTGAKLHIAHISTKNAVELVRQAKQRGIKVTAEVTPHHFTLSDEAVQSYDPNVKVLPPLRTKEDIAALLEGLKDGTIDAIATDHQPHTIEEKEEEFEYAPTGIVGLETAVGLALTELYHKKVLTLEQIIEKFAINPRKILNIPIPAIEVGKEANITIFDPDEIWTVDKTKFKSRSKNTPFDKKLLTGKPIGVINKGKVFINGKYA